MAQDDGKKVIDLAPGKYMEHDHDVSTACGLCGACMSLARGGLPCRQGEECLSRTPPDAPSSGKDSTGVASVPQHPDLRPYKVRNSSGGGGCLSLSTNSHLLSRSLVQVGAVVVGFDRYINYYKLQ